MSSVEFIFCMLYQNVKDHVYNEKDCAGNPKRFKRSLDRSNALMISTLTKMDK